MLSMEQWKRAIKLPGKYPSSKFYYFFRCSDYKKFNFAFQWAGQKGRCISFKNGNGFSASTMQKPDLISKRLMHIYVCSVALQIRLFNAPLEVHCCTHGLGSVRCFLNFCSTSAWLRLTEVQASDCCLHEMACSDFTSSESQICWLVNYSLLFGEYLELGWAHQKTSTNGKSVKHTCQQAVCVF